MGSNLTHVQMVLVRVIQDLMAQPPRDRSKERKYTYEQEEVGVCDGLCSQWGALPTLRKVHIPPTGRALPTHRREHFPLIGGALPTLRRDYFPPTGRSTSHSQGEHFPHTGRSTSHSQREHFPPTGRNISHSFSQSRQKFPEYDGQVHLSSSPGQSSMFGTP